MRTLVALLALTALTACAVNKETQVRAALSDAGVPAATAQCMAEPMARELSVSQLKALGRVAKPLRDSGRRYSQRELFDILRRDLDPETMAVVVRAGFGCLVRG